MAEVNQEMLLGFLVQAGGKVKNSELLSKFKPLLNAADPGQRASNRDNFKGLVNSLAVVKDEGGTKYVVLRKKYMQLMEVGAGEEVKSPGVINVTTISREGPPTSRTDVPQNRSSEEATSAKSQEEDLSSRSRGERPRRPRERSRSPEEVPAAEVQDPEEGECPKRHRDPRGTRRGSKESCRGPRDVLSSVRYEVPEVEPGRSVQRACGMRRLSLGAMDESSPGFTSPRERGEMQQRRRSLDLLEQVIERSRLPPLLSQEEQDKEGLRNLSPLEAPSLEQNREHGRHAEDPDARRESVFALVARIDTTSPSSNTQLFNDANATRGQHRETAQKPFSLPLRCPPPPIKITSEEDHPEVTVSEERTFLEKKEQFASPLYPVASLPKSPFMRRRQHDETGAKSPHLKRTSKALKVSEESKYSDTVPLESAEHDWLVKTTSGRLSHHIYGLLLKDSGLVEKKDFMCGFTALHWAAKSGNSEMLTTLIETAKKGGLIVDINMKSFGGYTPLHVAAIHGRDEVILKLVRSYGAKVNLRDWSGKKAHQYLQKDAPIMVRGVLDDPSVFSAAQSTNVRKHSKVGSSILGSTSAFLGVLSEDIAFHDLAKGLKKPPSLNKLLFNTPPGPKKKPKARGSVASFTSLHEEGAEETDGPLGKRRPQSEYYIQ
ncbi:ankyrin repeat domain-containing protein SOWAHA [Ambystoma mexicanum]|uniref:ankyrin repeat domain-containing protein SOWAHA n=1 Tax=Ambystoma mexicanum TaxID=8296 RepID=UPI0037E9980A